MGVLRALDHRLAEAGIEKADFWAPSWNQCRYNGRTWAVSAAADGNFALVWNKHFFRQAGLNPERPPRTIKELEAYAKKLTVQDEKTGRIERLGFLPTYVPHASIAVLTWGWAFGGRFYNEETGAFTCDDPRNVQALQWIYDLQEEYGGRRKLLAFQSGFGFSAQDPFNVGKLAMNISYISQTQEIKKFAPNLEFGIGPMPKKEGVESGSEWIGGWTMAIPYGDRGNEDEAFEFIRWMCASDEGTTFMARTMNLLPAYKPSSFFEEDVKKDRVLQVYYGILQRAKHTRPITPVNARYMTELMRALGRVLNTRPDDPPEDQWSPERALKRARIDTTREWEKMQKRTKATHTLSDESPSD
jgi:multiple sugar transport system substrate-binding protein